jgi:hypothetical protein
MNMISIINKKSILLFLLAISFFVINAQEIKKDLDSMSKEEILKMTNDELLALPIEDLAILSEKVGVSVDELLDLSIKTGSIGGFGSQLEDLNTKAYVHGYADVWFRNIDFNRLKPNQTFSMHYFNPMFGINVKDKIIAEIMLEYEHGGSEISMRYGIIDYAFSKYATFRVGKFLMPVGRFNEYLYPEHINIFVDRPLSHWYIVPSVWAEVGAQLRGNVNFTEEFSVNYSAYVVNGLEQKDKGYGGNIRNMRENTRDYNNDDKSFGGRIGIKPIHKVEAGFSYYTGTYSTDGLMSLSIICIDAEYKHKRLGVRGEYAQATIDTLIGNVVRKGFFVESSYRINKYFEPAIRYEQSHLPGLPGFSDIDGDGAKDLMNENVERVSFGLIIYPEPDLLSRFNFKINYNYIPNDGQGVKRREFALQAAIGF